VLDVHHLRKSFGSLVAVDDVSFALRKGELVGLLGPNGAGKTTTVSMIAGLLRPERGEVRIDGKLLSGDTDPAKRRIGFVPQDLALYEELTARENLRFFGSLYDLTGRTLDEAMASALSLVGLAERARDRVKTFSGGMKRRLNLAAGLLHDPDILLLDEPTVGVDPQSRNAIFENLELLKARGKALLYTTHYMEEVERLADRIVVIDHGRAIADDTLAGLRGRIAPVDGQPATLESVFLTLTGRSLRD
jgi:linearmycin/streptolysin S transport system ATP-binding protein